MLDNAKQNMAFVWQNPQEQKAFVSLKKENIVPPSLRLKTELGSVHERFTWTPMFFQSLLAISKQREVSMETMISH